MDALIATGARALARLIRDRQVSAVELTAHHLDRIARLDGAIRALAVVDAERALAAARAADDTIARGDELGPLHGVPVTVKEAFDVAGLATTWGVPAHAGNVAAADATIVARLRGAGAILLGKTNVSTMLGDFQATNPLFGATGNPWDLARTPGGSSGGAAAALAAGLTALDVGSDLGGSLRNPAHYCGVYAHKPTAGIVPMTGHALPGLPPPPAIACAGPLARTADDLALALDALAGAETPAWRLALPPPRRTSLAGLRVAAWADDPVAPVAAEITARVEHVAGVLARRGAVVSDRARPDLDVAACRATYAALVGAHAGAALPADAYDAARRRADALDPADASRPAMMTRALVLDHRAWIAREAERARLGAAWARFFADWDVVVAPIMATTAPPLDPRPPEQRTILVDGAAQPLFTQVLWAALATVASLPSTVFPTGAARDGLPVGLQAIGAAYDDRTTIEVARLLADELGVGARLSPT